MRGAILQCWVRWGSVLDVGGCLLEPEGRECVDVRGVCVVCWDVRGVCLLEGGKCVGVRGVWVVYTCVGM